MKYLKFFIYQFILIGCLMYINFYADKYLSLPFTKVDLLGVGLGILQIPFLISIFKFRSGFSSISKISKYFLTLLSGLLAIFVVGMMLRQVLPGLLN
jgi:hypothetical protein